MGVAFFQEAAERLPGRCDPLFDRAAAAYAEVCEGFQALLALHPPRPALETYPTLGQAPAMWSSARENLNQPIFSNRLA